MARGTASTMEPPHLRWSRLGLSGVALCVAGMLVVLASLTAVRATTARVPLDLFVVEASVLAALCGVLLWHRFASRYSVAVGPVVLIALVTLSEAARADAPFWPLAVGLGLVLIATQIAGRLARATACGCN